MFVKFKQMLCLAAMLIVATTAMLGVQAKAADMDRQQVEKIIHDYLMENPEVITKALNELENRRVAQQEQARKEALVEMRDTLENSKYQVVLGNPKGDVTLVEFFDYNCGYCRRSLADMMKLMEDDGNLRIVLKEFPVLGQASMQAAQVAIALNEVAPEKYEDFHIAMLSSKERATKESAMRIVKDLGVDMNKIEDELKSDSTRNTLQEVFTMAEKLSINGTPSYVIGDEVAIGAVGVDSLKEIIAQTRAQKN
ncbi:DsbA family protein [Polycladidibacter stylochi]|uniref:DsbA family protein n=1 Tax=Polycladidibacter stylochi TaxID=1807766 RepID=UPI0008306089|nr:DsbA family protein [Pseudovibrio stylochi]